MTEMSLSDLSQPGQAGSMKELGLADLSQPGPGEELEIGQFKTGTSMTEMSLSDLDFGKKRRANKFSFSDIKIVDGGEENVKKPKLQVEGCCDNAATGVAVSSERNDGEAFAIDIDDPKHVNEGWLLGSDIAREHSGSQFSHF